MILSNFQRLGAKKAATAAVFAWEKPDPIGLAAFEKSLAGFDSLVMAVPLSRGVVAAPMPPTLRRTSIPVEKIKGDTAALPLVNRLPIPGVILGGESTIAGFSVLESEPPLKFLPLLARWEDRVVFSFPLLTVLQRLDLPLDGVEVRLGEFLKLGPSGPIVPIDEAGRLAMPLKPMPGYAEISAEALIDGGDELFPKQAPDPVILRDDQTAAEPATREFSRNLSASIALIASSGGLTEAREFPRLSEGWEILLLSVVVLTISALCGASQSARNFGTAGLVGALLAAQWTAFGIASIWLPGLTSLTAIVAAVITAKFIGGWLENDRDRTPQRSHEWETNEAAHEEPEIPALVAVPAPNLADRPKVDLSLRSHFEQSPEVEVPEPAPLPEIEIQPEPVIQVAKTKKAPAKKTAAKKAAAKKTPAKKAATTKTPRTKKPDGNDPLP